MTSNNMTSAVEEVRVFLHGAEIKRRMVLDATKGKNTAVFSGLPQDISPESINASVEKGGSLISADFEKENFREPAVSKDIKRLTDKQERIRDEIREEMSRLSLLKAEENYLDSNKRIGGKTGLQMNDLKEFEAYFIQRNKEIGASKIATEKKLEDLGKEMERVTKELSGYPANVVRSAGKITVEFYAESDGNAEVTVSYYVNGARWAPFHEIRMDGIGAPVRLSMKGSVIQNTGEDWNSVKVKLSTGNPMLGNRQPAVNPWYIDLYRPQKSPVWAMAAKQAYDEAECCCAEMPEMDPMVRSAAVPAETTAVQEARTTTEFRLPAALDIPSSNKPSKIEIVTHTLSAEFFYYCACRQDTDAFLIAEIEGWESLNLLGGEVSIFQGNEYVGKTYLDPAGMNDKMEISLGRDRGIIITREPGNNMTGKGMIGKNKKISREWVITVRNTRSGEVKMKLLDQLPVSTNSDVTVGPIELSGAELEKETGILTWNLDIPSGGSVKKVLKYEVTYPKNGTVYLD